MKLKTFQAEHSGGLFRLKRFIFEHAGFEYFAPEHFDAPRWAYQLLIEQEIPERLTRNLY